MDGPPIGQAFISLALQKRVLRRHPVKWNDTHSRVPDHAKRTLCPVQQNAVIPRFRQRFVFQRIQRISRRSSALVTRQYQRRKSVGIVAKGPRLIWRVFRNAARGTKGCPEARDRIFRHSAHPRKQQTRRPQKQARRWKGRSACIFSLNGNTAAAPRKRQSMRRPKAATP